MAEQRNYRQVGIGEANLEAVTVGIEKGMDGGLKAAVWWEAVGDVDADEAEFDDVLAALAAAEAARELHGLKEVVIALQEDITWQAQWGALDVRNKEPIGDIRPTDLSSDEAYELAAGIEEQRDA
ncbi:MAG: hypothetical protein P0Y65_21225 [Candidatus Devosia phytovorans]|uniref:Uncharacterized protein n=1 Tax=Candidatus Devosia phytovorans TaxID=3121372 RepID=A0AAJ5VTR7_9HYPH|nr:hypothetical protein [Devosia sp.]WEK04663.1 MAG: hypothetical protein P0Y65_21225 [Devosia sp.]